MHCAIFSKLRRLTYPAASSAVLAALMLATGLAPAQDAWPSRPIKIVVPYSAGGSTDVVTRRMARALGERLGQNVVVENKLGGGGNIGMLSVVREKPDGYTFAAHDVGYVIVPHLTKDMPYDPAKDLVPVAVYVFSPLGVVVNANSPYKTLQDLINVGRANPGKLTYGSGGEGSSPHLSAEALAFAAGFKPLHVPYKGAGESVLALMGGQIDFLFTTPSTAAGNVKSGRLRVLAMGGTTRNKLLPDAPTFAESGLKDFSFTSWNGLWAPRGTPRPILDRMVKEIAAIMATPEMRTFSEEVGAAPNFAVGDDFLRMLNEEDVRWKAVIDKLGLEKK